MKTMAERISATRSDIEHFFFVGLFAGLLVGILIGGAAALVGFALAVR